MKKAYIYLWIIISLIGFSACDDKETVISSGALDGSISFTLNQPQYSNWTYVLDYDNAALDMDSLTCVQPAYGFTAAVTYTTQVSLSNTFANGTFQSLATTVNGEKVNVNTKEMNKALIALNGGSFSEPLPALKVYIRLKAFVSDAVDNPVNNDTLVKPLYSNAISLNIQPYIEPLAPFNEVTIRPWYIVGLGGSWTNSVAGLGSSLIPLSVISGSYYNVNGDGTFVYTGYFDASSSFKLIRDVGAWSPQWGMTGSTYTYNSGDNISVPTSGYYKLTLNSIDNKLSIEATTAPSKTYTSMGLIGEFNSWGADVNLTSNANTAGHIWYTTYTFASDYTSGGGCKFRANGGWDVNWGSAKFPLGIGSQGGNNIPYKAGSYTVILNDIDGCYYFIQ